jgi:ATP-dependent DNA ligase
MQKIFIYTLQSVVSKHMDTLVETLPTLYGIEKNGKTKIWTASIHSDGLTAWADIEYGYVDGKKQLSRRDYTVGKNIGKKNESTFLEQCKSETMRKWLDKKEKEQYTMNITTEEEASSSKVFPMLAHTYEPESTKKKKNDIVYPCFVQPKLDGLRCVVYQKDGKIMYQSRNGVYYETLDYLSPSLTDVFDKYPDVILDGELYTKDYPFEELAGMIRKKKSKLSDEDMQRLKVVKYHIYDVVDDQMDFAARIEFLSKILLDAESQDLVLVPTVVCREKEKFREMFSLWVEEGYEGIMLRNKTGVYRTNYRSHDLQKYKEFKEDEYEIVGYREGEGRDEGTVLWMCITPEGRQFSVRPRGSMELRRELYRQGDKYVGKKLTVIYQELSEMKVPRFPVGKDVRENY